MLKRTPATTLFAQIRTRLYPSEIPLTAARSAVGRPGDLKWEVNPARLERLTHIDRTDVAQKRAGYRTVKRSSWSTMPSALRSSTRQSPARSLLIVLRLYVR